MDNSVTVDRARAVLARLRDQLVEHQKLESNPRTMVPADLAMLLNETLAELEGIYGADWVRSASVNRWAFVPASNRNGANQSFPTVQRDVLLGYVKGALRRLNADVPMTLASPGISASTTDAGVYLDTSSVSVSGT